MSDTISISDNSSSNDDEYNDDFTLQSCPICFDSDIQIDDMVISKCNHAYCTACFRQYLRTSIESRSYPIECPILACKHRILPHTCLSLLGNSDDDDGHEACHVLIIEHESMNMMQYCANKTCSEPFEWCYEDDDDFFIDGEHFRYHAQCPMCKMSTCIRCKTIWHDEKTCDEFQDQKNDNHLLNLASKYKWNSCPRCGHMIEKTGGCDHMRCKCGQHFSYHAKNLSKSKEVLRKYSANHLKKSREAERSKINKSSGANSAQGDLTGSSANFRHERERGRPITSELERTRVNSGSWMNYRGGGGGGQTTGRGTTIRGQVPIRGRGRRNGTYTHYQRNKGTEIPVISLHSSRSEESNRRSDSSQLKRPGSSTSMGKVKPRISNTEKTNRKHASARHSFTDITSTKNLRTSLNIEQDSSRKRQSTAGNLGKFGDARDVLQRYTCGKLGYISLSDWLGGVARRRLPVVMHSAVCTNRCPYRQCSKKFPSLKALERHLCSDSDHPVWLCCGRPFQSEHTMVTRHKCLS